MQNLQNLVPGLAALAILVLVGVGYVTGRIDGGQAAVAASVLVGVWGVAAQAIGKVAASIDNHADAVRASSGSTPTSPAPGSGERPTPKDPP